MWWNNAGWGPMYGWWFMPIFGLLCMGIFFFLIFRVFNREGGCRGPFVQHSSQVGPGQDELLSEIKALRKEVEELRKQGMVEEGDAGDDQQESSART